MLEVEELAEENGDAVPPSCSPLQDRVGLCQHDAVVPYFREPLGAKLSLLTDLHDGVG